MDFISGWGCVKILGTEERFRAFLVPRSRVGGGGGGWVSGEKRERKKESFLSFAPSPPLFYLLVSTPGTQVIYSILVPKVYFKNV